MNEKEIFSQLNVAAPHSHKGQNGRLLLIGGSELFHAASMWSLLVASRIVDLVHFSSVPSNNALIQKAKEEFRNGIVVPRGEIESYITEDDSVLIGPGMVRAEDAKVSSFKIQDSGIEDILNIEDEGLMTGALTNYLIRKYPHKQWVIDAGALQMIDIELIPRHAILTPHRKELDGLWKKFQSVSKQDNGGQQLSTEEKAHHLAAAFDCIVVSKGVEDIICSKDAVQRVSGGNEGMTKGGTGDVLAGLIAALSCGNDPWISAVAGCIVNKRAGDELYASVGSFFNASDLAQEIPQTFTRLLRKYT